MAVASHHLKPADLPLVADNRGGLQKSYLLDAGHQLFHIGVIPHSKRVALKVIDQINRHHRHSPQLIIGNNREGKSGGSSSCEAAAFRVVLETISTLGVGVLVDFSDFPFESVVLGGSSGFFPSVGPAGATPSALPLGSVALGCSFDCFASVGPAVAAPSALPLRSVALGSSSGPFTLVGLAESDNCGLLSPPSPGSQYKGECAYCYETAPFKKSVLGDS